MSIFTMLRRNIKWRFHHAFTIVITILQPILWLVLYGATARQAMKNTGIEDYTAFIFPGLVVLVTLSACSSGGMMNYMMKADGSFYRILIAPVKRSSIVLGQVLEAVLCTFIEISVMVSVGLFFSAKFFSDLSIIPVFISLVFLTAFFWAGISYSMSLILPNEALYETAMNAVVLPVFFLSTALFPAEGLNGTLAVAVNLNPFTHIIDAMRSLMLYGKVETESMAFVLTLFIFLGATSFQWALYRLKKEMAM